MGACRLDYRSHQGVVAAGCGLSCWLAGVAVPRRQRCRWGGCAKLPGNRAAWRRRMRLRRWLGRRRGRDGRLPWLGLPDPQPEIVRGFPGGVGDHQPFHVEDFGRTSGGHVLDFANGKELLDLARPLLYRTVIRHGESVVSSSWPMRSVPGGPARGQRSRRRWAHPPPARAASPAPTTREPLCPEHSTERSPMPRACG